MAIATTTFAAIRDQMVTTIAALTPDRHSAAKFVYAPQQVEFADFRTWAEEFDDANFRWFAIAHLGWEPSGVSNKELDMRESQAELVIAYPHLFSMYRDSGTDSNIAEIADMAEEDLASIADAIGRNGGANYTSGQRAALESAAEIELGDGVTFAVLPLSVTYWYDMS